jgi:hypothetical protein
VIGWMHRLATATSCLTVLYVLSAPILTCHGVIMRSAPRPRLGRAAAGDSGLPVLSQSPAAMLPRNDVIVCSRREAMSPIGTGLQATRGRIRLMSTDLLPPRASIRRNGVAQCSRRVSRLRSGCLRGCRDGHGDGALTGTTPDESPASDRHSHPHPVNRAYWRSTEARAEIERLAAAEPAAGVVERQEFWFVSSISMRPGR